MSWDYCVRYPSRVKAQRHIDGAEDAALPAKGQDDLYHTPCGVHNDRVRIHRRRLHMDTQPFRSLIKAGDVMHRLARHGP